MNRTFLALAAVALAIVAAPSALAEHQAKPKPKKEKLTHVKLLAFNDFHGHLEPGTPGRSSIRPRAPPFLRAAPSTSRRT
jgi:2',3'-cyclic-nucleotide 2'-phosphodiesterase (5'-nucleotidase family)